MNLNKILALSLALVVLATVAVLTGTVGASPHLNSLIASPPPSSVPVNVVNTPLAVTGTVTANIGTPTVNANVLGSPERQRYPHQLLGYCQQSRGQSRAGARGRQWAKPL
jgi:hypothetical protein